MRLSNVGFVFGVALAAHVVPSNSEAACTWSFDWYCSDCAKIGGRTTGTQGGYGSESACESARSTVKSPVSTMSCDRQGWCDEPSSPRSSSPSSGGNQGGATSNQDWRKYYPARVNDDAYREEERRRMEEDRRARDSRENETNESFDQLKSETIGKLKGSTLDSERGSDDSLKLKTGSSFFGLKANPTGALGLKDPNAVDLGNNERAEVDPVFFIKPKQTLHIRSVPNPVEAPPGTWLRYVKSDRAGLILDALTEGRGNLDAAIAYLDGQIARHESNVMASSALSYLEGLKTSYIAAGVTYDKKTGSPFESADLDSRELIQAVSEISRTTKWPGPKNINSGPNPHDWRVKRITMMLAALEESPGNMEGTRTILSRAKDVITAKNAEYYLRGVFAYWDYLDLKGEGK